MAITDKLTGIANAIRSKTGKTESMTLDGMRTEIEGLQLEDLLPPSEYPDYVRDEVLEIVNKVRNVKQDDSIVFIAMSDSHYPADQTLNFYDSETIKSTVQANQAAKALAYMLDIDFVAHLGDVSSGAGSTTPEMLEKQIEGFLAYFNEARRSIPCFIAIGNHDAGIYYHDVKSDGNVYTMPGEYLYKNFTAHSESSDTVISGQEYGGYCYRDFADKKLRVYLLNTSEYLVYNQTDNATLSSQREWLAKSLAELNTKSDASEWGFIILCHYPADYGATMPLSQLLKAYVEGSSITISTAHNFSGKNAAKFVAQFHGHVHNFKHDKLSVSSDGSVVGYDAWRLCVPNGQYNRENYYGTFGGINFEEDASYTKSVNTANGTSFVVNVVNPSEEIIYSFCYGAGYDRTVGYGATKYHSVSCTVSGYRHSGTTPPSAVEDGANLLISLVVQDGYDPSTTQVSVKMGGVDITSSAVSYGDDGAVSMIGVINVTGTVVITVSAKMYPVNLLPISVDTDGTVYNGVGYKEGIRVSTSDGGYRTQTGMYASGYMPVADNETIVLRNVGTETVSYVKSYLIGFTSLSPSGANGQVELNTVTPEADGSIRITRDMLNAPVVYFRLSCSYLGDDTTVLVVSD